MPTTPQTQRIVLANRMCALIQNWRNDYQQAADLLTQYDNLQAGSGFAALPTCATNADGSLGDADTTPVPANVIDNRKVSTLEVAISSYNLGVSRDLIGAFKDLFDGVAVTTQAYAPAMLAATSGEGPYP